jgi:alkanesulfonate monooxygenase SsuD/methylene tetrahydromethanopterin reductase-like flavin-dependent oxidoreductase (luciferase family)
MKTIWFHMQGYRDLPDDFRKRYESIWITPPNDELCDSATVGKYLHWNLDELELADDLGFDGLGLNEHHQNGYGFPISPNLIAATLARRKSDAAIVMLGNTLPLYNPPVRVAEEMALLDCLSGGRLVAGWPIGSAMDTTGCYGITPTEVRPRYYEAHDLIKAAWTRPGPFPFNGKFTKLRYVNPWPKPLQKPHPPIWCAGGGSVETWKFAAENDYTYSYLSFFGHKAAKKLIDGYWNEVAKAGRDENPYRAGFAQLVVVGETDAEAEREYLPHIKNFFDKSLYIPGHHAMVPGYMTKQSMEFLLKQSGSATPFTSLGNDFSWKEHVENQGIVVGGSPSTVADRLREAVKTLRVGHLMVVLQIQSMTPEQTAKNTRLFAEKVLPKIRDIWDDEGWVDHWWPSGATRHATTRAAQSNGSGATRGRAAAHEAATLEVR